MASTSTSATGSDDQRVGFPTKASTSAALALPSFSDANVTFLSAADIGTAQTEAVQQLRSIFNLKKAHAQALLIHFQWSVEDALAAVADRGEDLIFKAVGIPPTGATSAALNGDDNATCGICMEDAQLLRQGCGHGFCEDCWATHIQVGISEGRSKRLVCMAYKCGALCEAEHVEAVLRARAEAHARAARKRSRHARDSSPPREGGDSDEEVLLEDGPLEDDPPLQEQAQAQPEEPHRGEAAAEREAQKGGGREGREEGQGGGAGEGSGEAAAAEGGGGEVSAAGLLERYRKTLVESYVDDNKLAKWCPSVPHCGRAALLHRPEPMLELRCPCGEQFCFRCGKAPHSPASCRMWAEWEREMQTESQNLAWLCQNSKMCPRCSSNVEKIDGCNLVRCACGQYFCWLCGEATGKAHTWTRIEGHSCGSYRPAESLEELAALSSSRTRAPDRYLHYYGRWKAHLRSYELESEMREAVTARILRSGREAEPEAAEARGRSEAEQQAALAAYSWLWEGLAQLFQCRRVLVYSYVFAYYFFGNRMFKDEITPQQNEVNQHLFEHHQAQLEVAVEYLSGLLTPAEGSGAGSGDESEEEVPDRDGATGTGRWDRLQIITCMVGCNKRCFHICKLVAELVDSLEAGGSLHPVAPAPPLYEYSCSNAAPASASARGAAMPPPPIDQEDDLHDDWAFEDDADDDDCSQPDEDEAEDGEEAPRPQPGAATPGQGACSRAEGAAAPAASHLTGASPGRLQPARERGVGAQPSEPGPRPPPTDPTAGEGPPQYRPDKRPVGDTCGGPGMAAVAGTAGAEGDPQSKQNKCPRTGVLSPGGDSGNPIMIEDDDDDAWMIEDNGSSDEDFGVC